jgi:DNA-binding PadR family transcriptional regulator
VLGLLVEQPDTVAGVGVRLVQRFPHARWSRSAVYTNLPSLVRQQHVRLVKEGHRPALNRYEATATGVAHFREWVRESAAVPPVLRDALQGKLAFSEREDLLALIETVRQEEEACRQKYATAHRRFLKARQLTHRSAGNDADWETMVRRVQVADEAKVWGLMVRRLQDLLEELEGLLGEIPASLNAGEAADG